MAGKQSSVLKNLILTETLEKARTIRKILGTSYSVLSTEGFLRDLPKTRFGINVENDFEMQYMTVRGKGELMQKIKKEALQARRVLFATDDSAEGEALANQYCGICGVSPDSRCRLVIDEITKEGVMTALESARPININLVNAYEARRTIDRIVSNKLNPYLWCKIYSGITVSRIQAIILKMICSKEKLQQTEDFKFDKPLTLTTILQAAFTELKFKTAKTIIILRQLYEGINIDGKFTGLITYFEGNDIRPSSEMKTPEQIKNFLTANQWNLYNLIWKYYNDKDNTIKLTANNLDKLCEQCNDFLLMRQLEEKNIPWGGLYTAAINSMLKRQYVNLTETGYEATQLGLDIVNALKGSFSIVIGTKSFIKTESQIAELAEGKADKLQIIENFYKTFNNASIKAMEQLGDNVKPKEPPVMESDQVCEKCGRKMIIRRSRYGLFLACPGYPECKNTKPYIEYIEGECPKCGKRLTKRKWNKGYIFYSCENFPKCDFSTWDEPQKSRCHVCNKIMLVHKFKDRPAMMYCSDDNCPSRVNHPINKIKEDLQKKYEKNKVAN